MAKRQMVGIKPHEQERVISDRKKVTIYFIGWEYWLAHKKNPPPIVLKQQLIFNLPDLGRPIELDEVYAADLIAKTRFRQKPIFMYESEGGAEMAGLLRRAIEEGVEFDATALSKFQVAKQVDNLSDDDILAIVKKRNLTIPAAFVEQTVADSEKPAPKFSGDKAKKKEDKEPE